MEFASRKGVFPYDYVTNFIYCNVDSLPPVKSFFNTLKNSPCKIEDYKHAQDVWEKFNIKTLGEYSDVCLTLDVT